MTIVMAKTAPEELSQLARNLRRFRTDLGLSQAKMGQVVGVPADTWIKWETGHRTPGGDMIFRIADALDRPSDDLNSATPSKGSDIAPGFGLAVVDDSMPLELVKRASTLIRDLNREHRKMVAAAGRPAPDQHDRAKLAKSVAPPQGRPAGKASPAAKPQQSGTRPQSK